jgi:RimJ/RimL family protein N-acetyltransferase
VSDPSVVTLRPAAAADGEALWQWRNDPAARRASFDGREIPWEEHADWLARTLGRPDRRLWIVEVAGTPAGMVRLDVEGDCAAVSLNVAPAFRGAGVGPAALARAAGEAFGALGLSTLVARVKVDNPASRAAFERAGFTVTGTGAGVITVRRTRRTP